MRTSTLWKSAIFVFVTSSFASIPIQSDQNTPNSFQKKKQEQKKIDIQNVDVWGAIDNPYLIDVWLEEEYPVPTVKLTRNFRDHLRHTVDRERMERVNGEN